MQRDACFRLLAGLVDDDDIVVSTYTSAFEWLAIRPHPLNYVSVGAMGLASSHGLGLALALPARRVLVLDGDGSLLMNLGSLVTIAAAAPRRFVHFACRNGSYEANGGHPIPGGAGVDFAGLARSAGYARTHAFGELEAFGRAAPALLRAPGPTFIELHLERGDTEPLADYGYVHGEEARSRFAAALATTGSGGTCSASAPG